MLFATKMTRMVFISLSVILWTNSNFSSQTITVSYHKITEFDLPHGSDVAWSPNGSRLAVTDFPKIIIFNSTTWETELILPNAWVSSVVWSPDGTQIASVAGGDNRNPYENLFIWDSSTGELKQHLRRVYIEPTDILFILPIYRLSWSPNADRIISDTYSPKILVWDLNTETSYLLGEVEWGVIGEIDWSPDASHVVAGITDGTIRIWDSVTGENLQVISGGGMVDWHPSENRILGSGFYGKIVVWDSNTGQELLTLEHGSNLTALRWNFDGSIIASGGLDGVINVGDSRTGTLLFSITEHEDLIMSMDWHPSKNMLASISYDGEMMIWQIGD